MIMINMDTHQNDSYPGILDLLDHANNHPRYGTYHNNRDHPTPWPSDMNRAPVVHSPKLPAAAGHDHNDLEFVAYLGSNRLHCNSRLKWGTPVIPRGRDQKRPNTYSYWTHLHKVSGFRAKI